jgi:hypothetical protein
VKARLERYGFVETIGQNHFFPTKGTAVDAYIAETGTKWTDWEEGPAEPVDVDSV